MPSNCATSCRDEEIYRHILAHGPASLLNVLPELIYLALAPFIGSRAATRMAQLDEPSLQPDASADWSTRVERLTRARRDE